jgi:multiple sugar transport system ATP-binding protein
MNLVEAEVTDGRVQFAGLSIPLTGNHVAPGRVVLGIRPQDFSLAETADAGLPTIEVEPAIVEELGSATHAIFHIDAPPVDTEAVRAATDEGDSTVLLASDRRALFTATLEEGTPVTIGRPLRLAVNPARFHFFDLETSARVDTAGQLV